MQKTLLGIVISSALFCSISFATEGSTQSTADSPAHPGGWIIGVDGGHSETNSADSDLIPNSNPHSVDGITDNNDGVHSNNQDNFTKGIHIGHDYNVTDNLLMGAESNYKDVNKESQ